MKNTGFLIVLMLVCMGLVSTAQTYQVKSPNEQLEVKVTVNEKVSFEVLLKGQQIVAPSLIGITIDSQVLGSNAKAKKGKKASHSEILKPHVKQKFAEFENKYNQLSIPFMGNYSLEFRAFNDGAAYRWVTSFKSDKVIVNAEEVNFTFPEDLEIWFPEEEKIYTHQERQYKYLKLSEITTERFGSTGMLVNHKDGVKVYLSEADLTDYPGMFLKGSESAYQLTGKFSNYPKKTKQVSDRDVVVESREDYLAETSGSRTYPWRLMIITEDDGQLIESEMVYKLSPALKLDDVSWIKPGKVAWDWFNANNIYGVDFKAGVNTETYKYYIDFASENNIEYIILDEGWYHLEDVLKIKEECDVQEIINYGKTKNVDVILWVTWKAFYDKLDEAIATFAKWGAKGVKVDFMQRDDQWMVNYYHELAKKCADHKLLVDFHGSYKPTGLRRAYPNVITREGIFGGEQNKWSTELSPEHNVTLPFTRMVAGPMDYTPGAMLNCTKKNFRNVFTKPMAQGTRCHQLAMYVVFESPLQMLCDNPTHYKREPETMEFLREVPSVWDDTKILQAKVSDYVAIARKNGDKWYVGAMTDWDKRDLRLKFDFLPKGEYKLKIWQDGINADQYAVDMKQVEMTISNKTYLQIKLAPGGGWVGIIEKK